MVHRLHAPAGLSDMDAIPHQLDAWHETVSEMFDAARRLMRPPGETEDWLQFCHPRAQRGEAVRRKILWQAMPQHLVYEYGLAKALELADQRCGERPCGETVDGTPFNLPYREQREYCEWHVERDARGKIRRVTFSTETLEYWWSLAQGYCGAAFGSAPLERQVTVPAKGDLNRVLLLYNGLLGRRVDLGDITFEHDIYVTPPGGAARKLRYRRGDYNPWNRFTSRDGLVHMSGMNTLSALINQCANGSIGRTERGLELRDPTRILGAGDNRHGAGGINSAGDNAIVGVVGELAREGLMVSLADPVAIVMFPLDTRGWRLPGGRPAGKYWRVLRGTPDAAVRAVYEVPEGEGFTIDEITIDGVPIRYGSQIAGCLTVGVEVVATPRGAGLGRASLPAVGCPLRNTVTGTQTLVPDRADTPMAPQHTAAFPEHPEPCPEPTLDDDEIQGHVLAGFRQSHQWVIGFDIVAGREDSVRSWLRKLLPQLSMTREVATHNHLYRHLRRNQTKPAPAKWLNLAFSFAGLSKLAPRDAAELALSFREGPVARSVMPDAAGAAPDLLAVLAADRPELLDDLLGDEAKIRRDAEEWGLAVKLFRVGTNHKAVEHFGFKDGISQPAVRGLLSTGNPLTPREIDLDASDTDARYRDPHGPEHSRPGEVLVWPGEFVLGYPRQSPRHPRHPAPAAAVSPLWRNGSYLVYMRLEQDVAAFEAHVAAQAAAQRISPALARARIVGRWPSGAPLVAHPTEDPGTPSGHFAYADAAEAVKSHGVTAPRVPGDPTGARCPFSAHIRKVNPRDSVTEEGAAATTLRRRMLRRGIRFDAREDDATQGLLFLSFQASIEDQFEAPLRNWTQDPLRPAAAEPAVDALIGRLGEPDHFVRILEGGYFFAPSRSAIERLARR